MPTQPITREHQDVLKHSISDLIVLRDQLSGIENIDQEQARVQAKLDQTKKYLAGAKGEVKEALHYRDKYLAEARDKLAESERLDKEIKEKRVVVSQLDEYVNKIRQKLG